MKSLILFTFLPAFYAQYADYGGYDYGTNSGTDSSQSRPAATTQSATTTKKPQNDFELFESITEIIRYSKEELENLTEHPFLAEHKAYDASRRFKQTQRQFQLESKRQ